jgi:hypothetical protein
MGLLLCATAGGAEEALSRRAPAVARNLQSRYKMPDGYVSPQGFAIPGVESAKGLTDLVNIERHLYPGACVTAGFYDFRTVSRYRSHPGLHLGYDIAMPAGTPAACGWPGVVSSVVTWSGEEHGITVVAPDGRQITYGHLSPRVKVGQVLKAGEVVGVVVRDHVDVKMRDANGNYRDYGAGQGGIMVPGAVPPIGKGGAAGSLYNTPEWLNPDWFKPEPTKEILLTTWLVACNSRDLAKEEYDQLGHQAYLRKLEEQQLQKRLDSLQENQKLLKMSKPAPELVETENKIQRIAVVRALDTQQLKLLEQQLQKARAEANSAKKAAEDKGLTYADVDGLVEQAVSSDKSLSQDVDSYKRTTQSRNSQHISELQSQLEETEHNLYRLQEMQKIGGVDLNELETAKEKRRLLQVELRAAKPEPQDWFFREGED